METDFRTFISQLSETEQTVLFTLLKYNCAMSIKTIRNKIIEDLMKKHIPKGYTFRHPMKRDTYSEIIKVHEKELKSNGIRVPSWNGIKHALENLVKLKIVKQRVAVIEKADVLFFVVPEIYNAWLKVAEQSS